MKIEYSLSKEDFLTHNLFAASKSKIIAKRRFSNRLIPALAYLCFGMFVYFIQGRQNIGYLTAFTGISFIWFFFSTFYQRWIYKKYYSKFIDTNYKDRIGELSKIGIEEDMLKIENSSNIGNLNLNEVVSIEEISTHAFLNLKSKVSIILPKKMAGAENIAKFIEEIENKRGIKTIKNLEWRWK